MTDRHQRVETWVTQYKDRVYRLAFTLLGDVTAAEDAAQESLYHMARWCLSHPEFTPTDPWVWQVTRNAVRDLARRQPPKTVPLEESMAVENPEESGLERLDVARALARLNQTDREILVFFYFMDLSGQEVARVLGISPTAARIRLSRARKRFKAVFEMAVPIQEGATLHENP